MFSASKTAVPSGYNIANSLRFRSSASAYLSRTPASAGNRQTWTWSGWVKRGALGVQQFLFDGRSTASTNPHTWISFSATDALLVGTYDTVDTIQLITSQVFRDPSAWYHIVCVLDTTQATAANRVKLFINGAQVTAFSTATYPPQNFQAYVNAAQAHSIGAGIAGLAGTLLDGYLAEVNFIDGQALPPTAFGTINKENGVWSPSAYTGTYGTNGFRLNFSNGTSTTTLGYDSSGNGNNWTTNNISLTSGVTYDSMWDSPTSYDNGVNGVGNYATLNRLWNTSTATHVISDGNLKITQSGAGATTLYSTLGVTSGSYYFETNATTVAGDCFIGIFQSTGSYGSNASLGNGVYRSDGNIYNGSAWVAYGATYTSGDVIGVAFNISSSTINFYKNNVAQGQKSVTYTNTIVAAIYSATSGNVLNVNFGQRPFAYTPPSGYKSLCTYNLPTPTIQNGAGYMAATLYTGNGSSQSIVNTVNSVSFQPDFLWVKDRTTAYGHILWDSVRGISNYLSSSSTAAEGSAPTALTSLNSNGFTLGNVTSVNANGDSFIGWQWKAGGTAVTNTAGSITSSVSANPTAGFSVVTWTGNGSGTATVGHGLGVAPAMVITKSRSAVNNWWVAHSGIPTSWIQLDTTGAAGTGGGAGGSINYQSTFTSSVFGFIAGSSNTNNVNANGSTYVAYCFAAIAGYSAFGSYTGNGSADGPFVYCGFRPRYVLIKRTDTTADWVIWDTARNPYNAATSNLYPDLANAEYTDPSVAIDFVASGFKLRNTNIARNASGGTYIYAAFAENPFKYSLAR